MNTVGERGQLRVVGSAYRLKVSADQHSEVGIGPRDSAEYLPAAAGRLDAADANLQMPFAVAATPDERRIQAARISRRGALDFEAAELRPLVQHRHRLVRRAPQTEMMNAE